MFKRLRNKFLILNMSIISVMMITAFAVIYMITYNNMKMENQNKLLSLPVIRFEGSSNSPKANGSVSAGLHIIRNIPSDYSLSFSIRVDSDGKISDIDSYIDMSDESYHKAAELAWNNKKNNSTINLDGKLWEYTLSPIIENHVIFQNGQQPINTMNNGGYEIKFLDVTDTHKTLGELLATFILVGIIMLIVIFIISLYFANRAIKPIAEVWEKQKQLVADASHELKTPLAIINANSDALLANEEETIKSQKKWINYIKTEICRMTKLINDLLYLAKTENASIRKIYSSINISSIANNVVLSMEAVAFEKGIKLSHKVEQDIMVKGDSEQIKQVVMILLDNAIKYTDEKGYINISLKKTKRYIVFSIKNSGKGISKQDLPKLFDRFYRVDPSRTHENGGYGLGLSIAKAIIDSLGGSIYAESVENESTTFTFTLGIYAL
ncbi:sensor histidine kinase [Clostridium sp. WILCCON 0269]|uniref:histidine kinase n=1 Tax=Candidatus Clostridium eludens TaxID=3381663 RepID=A0ABW8SHA1_9CLOT